jgi:hypothetical protein
MAWVGAIICGGKQASPSESLVNAIEGTGTFINAQNSSCVVPVLSTHSGLSYVHGVIETTGTFTS